MGGYSHNGLSWPCGTRLAVYTVLGILVSQFRNKRRRAIHFDPGGVSF